jgi:potassium-dependent mechanosensitive channel
MPGLYLGVILLYRASRKVVLNWLGYAPADQSNLSPLRRLWRVAKGALLTAIMLILFGIVTTVTLELTKLATPRFDQLAMAFLSFVSPAIFQTSLAYLLCAPNQPEARLIAIDRSAARTIPIFVALASIVQSFTNQIATLSDQLLLPISLVAGQSAAASAILIVLVGLLLVALKRQSNTVPKDVPEPHYFTWFVKFIPLLWLMLLVAVGGLLYGYLALSYFITGKILDTLLVVVLMVLAHHLVDAFVDALHNTESAIGSKARQITKFTDKGIARAGLALRILADILVVVLGIPWLFALWTLTWIDFRSLLNSTMAGVRFGNIAISPMTIIALLGVLAIGILITRFLTSWLDRRLLSQTHMNKGVQDSVKKGANYFGYFLAAAFALSAAGFDFSSFTIIAGALGVGIGFGLQSIVNNFVSGLILLAERPVRVGDWVALAPGEGIVKKINVRSTEIETFDNCTIIVPNSLLITEAVRNWTHRDTLGRFFVGVGVKQDTDVENMQRLLNEIVTSHPKVLRHPPPTVQLSKFGTATLDFELRGHVADVFEAVQVASDLRFAIAKKFAEMGIKLPTYLELPNKK